MASFGVGGSYFGFNPAALVAIVGVAGGSYGFNAPAPAKVNHPAFPQSISDPGYPQNSIAEGTVVLEVTVDKGGNPIDIRVVHDIPTLTEISRSAVRSWRFLPAVDSGETVEGKVIVAIVYQRPV
jgi:TonB family protein